MKPPKLPEFCYALLPSEMADRSVKEVTPIGIKLAENGYYTTDWKWKKEHAVEALNDMNRRLGVTPEVADQMQTYSMFGWPDFAYQQKERMEQERLEKQ